MSDVDKLKNQLQEGVTLEQIAITAAERGFKALETSVHVLDGINELIGQIFGQLALAHDLTRDAVQEYGAASGNASAADDIISSTLNGSTTAGADSALHYFDQNASLYADSKNVALTSSDTIIGLGVLLKTFEAALKDKVDSASTQLAAIELGNRQADNATSAAEQVINDL